MRVVILTTEQQNQVALCHKLLPHCEVAAIVLSRNVPRQPPAFRRRLRAQSSRASARILGRPLGAVWQQMQQAYRARYPALPDVPLVHVNNINDAATVATLRQHEPELIIVSGTNLVGRKTLASAPPSARFINLHTGISPYVKGGPNCTNWCLAEGTFHLIGNTIMWLDPGIDTGHIIATERTPLDGQETLFELHWKVMEHAHDLYSRVVRRLARGESLPAIPQDSIAVGRTFYNAEWDGRAARRALNNFKRHYAPYFMQPDSTHRPDAAVRLFPLGPD
jgi:methionyl-tRNA formyltransferase